MNVRIQRNAFSLLEITAALVISATVAVAGIQYLRPAGDTGKQRSCDLTRELLQNDAQRYFEYTGSMPGADLKELVSPEYSGAVLPAGGRSGGTRIPGQHYFGGRGAYSG